MRQDSKIARWGNSLAIRIPLAIAKQASLSEGDSVKLALDEEGGIRLIPARRRYELADLVNRISPRNRHRETDWGGPRGKESW
jgi:antitoxin MazE